MDHGWDHSARAWIDVIGEDGDWGRKYVLDAPMLERCRGRGFTTALDLGCGEGRFCRQLQAEGITTIGIDPTAALIERARSLDATGDYRVEPAEALSLGNGSVDLVVAYLSLIDIPALDTALDEVLRVLRPEGTLLIANLQPFNTACPDQGWSRNWRGRQQFRIDHYLQTRPVETAWRGIRITNWHRPAQVYFRALLERGFRLVHFDEPMAQGVEGAKADRYNRVPNFLIMEWRKERC